MRTQIGRHAFGSCPKLVLLPDGYSDENGRCGHSVSDESISPTGKDRGVHESHAVGFQDEEYGEVSAREFSQYFSSSTSLPPLEYSLTSL